MVLGVQGYSSTVSPRNPSAETFLCKPKTLKSGTNSKNNTQNKRKTPPNKKTAKDKTNGACQERVRGGCILFFCVVAFWLVVTAICNFGVCVFSFVCVCVFVFFWCLCVCVCFFFFCVCVFVLCVCLCSVVFFVLLLLVL